jgi:hypothetical protein
MGIEIRFSVMSPEPHRQKVSAGGFAPSAGGPGPGKGGTAPGMGRAALVTSGPAPSAPSMARRLDSLENKTVYLVDTGFGGSYRFMQQLQKWFSAHMPSVTTIRKRKTGGAFMDDTTDLWEEIKAKGDAVILGVGG